MTFQAPLRSPAADPLSDAMRRHALMIAPEGIRQALEALYAIHDDVIKAGTALNDPGVANARLAWWRSEIERLFDEQAQHPASRVLMQAPWRQRISPAPLQSLVAAAEHMLQQNRQLDFAGLEYQCRMTGGQVARLAAALLNTSGEGQAAAEDLGTASAIVQNLRDTGRHIRLGRINLSLAELQTYGVTAAELLRVSPPWGYSDRFTRLMAFQCGRAREITGLALRRIPPPDRRQLRPLVALARMDLAWLDALPRHRYELLHQQIALNPLRSAWIAFKTRMGA